MSEKKVGKRLLTWVLVLVMTLSLLPLNVLAAHPVGPAKVIRPDDNKYLTYEFYVDGALYGEKRIVKNGDKLQAPETPEKEWHRFIGWYDENDTAFTGFGEQSGITESKTIRLDAKFEEVYYVYFHAPGENGNIVKTKEGTTGEEITVDDVSFPVEHEESITGWYTDKTYASGTKVESVTLEKVNIHLYAKVENGHWITFNSAGGSYVEPLFVTDTTKEPTAPTKSGYDFAGWYDGDTKFSFGGTLDSNKDLTAHWTAKNAVNYTVIHRLENADDDDYSYKESETLTGTAGELTEEAVDKSYEGFTLDKVEQKEIAGDGSTIVNVYYKRNVYTVTFASDEHGDDLICGKEAHKHTYTDYKWVFGYKYKGGCYPSNNFSRYPICGKEEHTHHRPDCYGILLKNLTITAKYGANISDKWPTYNGSNTWKTSKNGNTYQVNIDTMPLGGATFYGPKTGYGSETAYYYVEVLPGESGTNHNGTTYKLHHSDTSPGTGYSVSEEDKYSITGFTYKEGTPNGYAYDNAKFYYTRDSYNIIFINGGNTENTKSKKYQQDISTVSYTPTAPAGKEGYEFAGWFDNEPCEGTAYNFTGKTMPAQNITVYAKWKAPTFTVTVHNSDKKVLTTISNVPLRGTISKDAMPTDEVTLAEGDTFLGWTYEDGTPFNFNTAITKNIDLYARVGNKTGYSVTYDYKDGSNLVTDPSKYAKGAFATVFDGPDPTPANQVFLGWTTEVNGTAVEYYPNSSIEITGDVTLYAVYGDKAAIVKVTYHSNFGTDSKHTTDAMPNNDKFTVADYSALKLPDRTGYEFTGWSTTSGEKAVEFKKGDGARADTNGSNDLYAQWKPIQITEEITVTIKGNTSTVTYDGQPHTVNGYDIVSITGNADYTQADVSLKSEAQNKYNITQTNAGTYTMALDASDFVNTNDKFTNVEFVIAEVGSLTITKRSVTLTSASASKVYDGTALTKPEVTVTGDGFVTGEVADIKATGTITDFGEVTNTITYNEGANFKADNYEITTTEGKLTITKRSVTLTSETANKVYDGTPLTKPEVTVTGDGFVTGEVTDIKATGTVTNVGEVTNTITYNEGTNFKADNYEITTTEGKLTITKRPVTLTSASDSKVYDGTALTKPEVTVTGSFVDGEVTDIKATGTITDVGTVTNTITFAKGEKFKDSNYAITKTEGTLEVTPITDKVTVTITGNTKTVRYNGKEQSVTGFTYTAPEGVTVTLNAGSKAEAKGTDKGTYYMDLTKGDFIVSSKIYKEFEIIVKDGYLEITRSGGHHPRPKPTVEIEDDDALGLNTTDHFAYIVGYGNGEVRPQNNITRAEVATIFFRLLTDDVRDENLTKTNRYSDVTRADWYNTAVSTLSSMGIITGYPDGTFRPNAAITRAEFAAIAARFDHDGDKTAAKFSDIASHWAKDEISIAYNNGWITGYPDGTFGPQRDITRAETMTLVNRVLNRQPETEDDLLPNMTVWTDNANPKAWYYLAVQEATNSHYYKFKTNSKYEKWTELRETRDWTQLEK